ncbi:Protein of unknown function DUF839 [gamma proteobacterium HdN1]|nr:Protein of unknown function DUF839 [gamma proteobacterium HdN1]
MTLKMSSKSYLEINNSGLEAVHNHSENAQLRQIVEQRFSRRSLLQSMIGATAVSFMGVNLIACGSNRNSGGQGDGPQIPGQLPEPPPSAFKMNFRAIPTSRADTISVPEGYSWAPLAPWGTPITGSYPYYLSDGRGTGKDALEQIGQCHDGMHFFPIAGSSEHGILAINHEYIEPNLLHANGPSINANGMRPRDEVLKEMASHGVSIVEVKRSALGGANWEVVQSAYNRRVTALTDMEITGPARGHTKLKTKFSATGTHARGTLNNCSSGPTPWGTYLTAEENWAGYFANQDASMPREHARYDVETQNGRYSWELAEPALDHDISRRFDASSKGASAQEDYRNEPNHFGWMVEIDPFDPSSTPKKRTSLGRFGHEGVVFAKAEIGKPIVCYSGDDSRYEYIYKFISKTVYQEGMKGDDLLNEGTLYVAKFNAIGKGQWLALDLNDSEFAAKVEAAKGTKVGTIDFDGFSDQGDVLINTRLAADIAGATKMDRPEWGAICPRTGRVYFTLTNNTKRKFEEQDAANPRANNSTGHIIRWLEREDHRFDWDIFLLAGGTTGDMVGRMLPGKSNEQALTADNILSCPDGVYFDAAGGIWIQTDMSGSMQDGGDHAGDFGNNQLLLANPETGEMKRFLTGPTDCEITGISMTPDRKTMFVNVQHPGDRSTPSQFTSHFPTNDGLSRPRCTTVVISRDDGGIIGD